MLSAASVAMRAAGRRVVRPSISSTTATSSWSPSPAARRQTLNNSQNLYTKIPATPSQQRRGYAATTNPNPPLGKKNASNDVPSRIGLIGARGYTGQALVDLLNKHPYMDLCHVSSRELVGQVLQGYNKRKIIYEDLSPEKMAQLDKDNKVDCWVMALPNGVCKPFVEALDKISSKSVIIDLSADNRSNDSWTYALPELTKRSKISQSTRISNPGCYSTGAQLGIAPILEHLGGAPSIFGVSGYSGAGTKPSPNNDIDRLKDNLAPYSLTGHIHEREMSRHLGTPVSFMPHVASWFRGIHLTINLPLNRAMTSRDIRQIYQDRYAGEKLVKVGGEAPLVKSIVGLHRVEIGAFATDSTGMRVVVCATIDNLNKGASTQCLQNMNLALGYAEFEGIPTM